MTPDARAAKIISDNRFLSLACTDKDGPWVAPINYVIGPGRTLSFYSAVDARHSLAVAITPRTAAAIFDSRASSEDVDGLQLSLICTEVEPSELETVHQHYFATNFASEDEKEWWLRPPDAFLGNGPSRFYALEIVAAYVIDFESVERDKIDRRIAVDPDTIWQILEDANRATP